MHIRGGRSNTHLDRSGWGGGSRLERPHSGIKPAFQEVMEGRKKGGRWRRGGCTRSRKKREGTQGSILILGIANRGSKEAFAQAVGGVPS